MENLRPLESKLALLLVSHDREVVRHADDVFEIDNGIALRIATATV
jgi:ABC-type lipoprotein export system ATPase subunit